MLKIGEFSKMSHLTHHALCRKKCYKIAGLSRECYNDGIWNKESVEDWLTEVQLPIE